MKQIARGFAAIIILTLAACSASKKSVDKTGFKTTESGMKYMFCRDVSGTTAKEGDFVEIHINTHYNDSTIFDSRTNNSNKPVQFPVNNPKFHGDLAEAIMMMSPGDSLQVKVSVDSIISGQQRVQPWMKPGNYVSYTISLLSVKTREQYDKEQQREKEYGSSDRAVVDDGILKAYFQKFNLKPTKTSSGLYYIIKSPGSGEKAKPGQEVAVNYTGTLLVGTKFDSNTDPQFNHVEPFKFQLGRGNVIRGWDEGVALLNKGASATFYIPSPLAYGAVSPAASIPPNSILVFDVELIDIK